MKPFNITFDLINGYSTDSPKKPTRRYLSNMIYQFASSAAAEDMIKKEDVPLYDFYEMGMPETEYELQFGTSIIHPGQVQDEYFMTKGHFHQILDTAEVYLCLSGEGVMLMETPEGDVDSQTLKPGCCVYVPGRYAHRSINTGKEPLVLFFAFRGDAGHDYGTIEEKGYRKMLLERDGEPMLVDNPRWQDDTDTNGD